MYQVNRVWDGDRFVFALVRKAVKFLHYTVMTDEGVKHRTAPVDEAQYLQPLLFKGKPYPVQRAVKYLRAVGKRMTITEAAKSELAAAMGEIKEATA